MTDIAIDFGGSNIKMGLVREGAVLCRMSLPARSEWGLKVRLSDVRRCVDRMLAESRLRLSDCSGIAVAMPGIVDAHDGRVLAINAKYSDALEFDFNRWADAEFGLPFLMENDARAALAGEWLYGAAQGENDAVLAIFGTGIGSAALVEGRLLRGRHHQAGILGGHMITDAHGNLCTCGNRGCVEAMASHAVLAKLLGKLDGYRDSLLAKEKETGYLPVIKAAAAGDRLAQQLLNELIIHWSAGIVNLIHAYDPSVVILSGGLMKSADVLLPRIEAAVKRHAWTPWGEIRFAVAEDPDSSVLLGLSGLLRKRCGEQTEGDDHEI